MMKGAMAPFNTQIAKQKSKYRERGPAKWASGLTRKVLKVDDMSEAPKMKGRDDHGMHQIQQTTCQCAILDHEAILGEFVA